MKEAARDQRRNHKAAGTTESDLVVQAVNQKKGHGYLAHRDMVRSDLRRMGPKQCPEKENSSFTPTFSNMFHNPEISQKFSNVSSFMEDIFKPGH